VWVHAELWPLEVYFAAVLAVVVGMVAVSYVLGQRHVERATGEPYESGVVSTGSAQIRFSAKFYLVAMLFVIFDLEAVFLVAWAIAFREVGWPGYVGMLVFLLILVAGLAYEWRMGALEWGSSGRRRLPPPAARRPPGAGAPSGPGSAVERPAG
jgi:NADH-quinone oxidoreductase subunit A